jgi:hypothetical protein
MYMTATLRRRAEQNIGGGGAETLFSPNRY